LCEDRAVFVEEGGPAAQLNTVPNGTNDLAHMQIASYTTKHCPRQQREIARIEQK
jgi:hypothetical protein